MATTPQDLADAIKAAQGPADADTAVQDDANLKLATGIWNFLTAQLKVAPGIVTSGGPTTQTTTTFGNLV